MANPSVTYTFTNGNVADAGQVNTNFQNIIDGLTDGTKSLNIDALTCAGAFTANGSVDLGNASGDTISLIGTIDTNVTVKSTDAGATAGPDIIIDRDSASAADSDALGRIIFRGNDDAGTPADNDYASIEASIVDSGAGSEDGKLDIKISVAGSPVSYITAESGKGVSLSGLTDGSAVSSGKIGQKLENAGASSGSGTVNLTSVTLTPGDWDLVVVCNGNMSSGGATDYVEFAISTANNNLTGAFTVNSVTEGVSKGMFTTGQGNRGMGSLKVQINITSETTYYLNSSKSGTGTVSGRMFARRRA